MRGHISIAAMHGFQSPAAFQSISKTADAVGMNLRLPQNAVALAGHMAPGLDSTPFVQMITAEDPAESPSATQGNLKGRVL